MVLLCKNILADFTFFSKYNLDEISLKIYLALGNEIKRDLNKNNFLVEEHNNKKINWIR